jgi:hypothetical protein
MEHVPDTGNWANQFDRFGRNVQLKRTLDVLENENMQLRKLVVQLSETIIRNVTARS